MPAAHKRCLCCPRSPPLQPDDCLLCGAQGGRPARGRPGRVPPGRRGACSRRGRPAGELLRRRYPAAPAAALHARRTIARHAHVTHMPPSYPPSPASAVRQRAVLRRAAGPDLPAGQGHRHCQHLPHPGLRLLQHQGPEGRHLQAGQVLHGAHLLHREGGVPGAWRALAGAALGGAAGARAAAARVGSARARAAAARVGSAGRRGGGRALTCARVALPSACPQFKGGEAEFVPTKLMTRLTYTLDEVSGGVGPVRVRTTL